MDFPKSEFWTYSSQIWTLPEVENICLELQSSCDANVNMLLYCCWIGDKKLNLNDDDLQLLLDTIQPWQSIIKPLRDSRRMMQQHLIAMPANMVDQTVTNMSEMEVNAEHMTQLALEKTLNLKNLNASDDLSDIESSLSNINRYLNTLDSISDNDDHVQKIGLLLNAIFQDEEAVQMAMMSQA